MSFIGCFKKKFKIKMLFQMLLTLKVVYIQVPDMYPSLQYFHYHSQIEDFKHLWLCPKKWTKSSWPNYPI
jgi:hypothetical protein